MDALIAINDVVLGGGVACLALAVSDLIGYVNGEQTDLPPDERDDDDDDQDDGTLIPVAMPA